MTLAHTNCQQTKLDVLSICLYVSYRVHVRVCLFFVSASFLLPHLVRMHVRFKKKKNVIHPCCSVCVCEWVFMWTPAVRSITGSECVSGPLLMTDFPKAIAPFLPLSSVSSLLPACRHPHLHPFPRLTLGVHNDMTNKTRMCSLFHPTFCLFCLFGEDPSLFHLPLSTLSPLFLTRGMKSQKKRHALKARVFLYETPRPSNPLPPNATLTPLHLAQPDLNCFTGLVFQLC